MFERPCAEPRLLSEDADALGPPRPPMDTSWSVSSKKIAAKSSSTGKSIAPRGVPSHSRRIH